MVEANRNWNDGFPLHNLTICPVSGRRFEHRCAFLVSAPSLLALSQWQAGSQEIALVGGILAISSRQLVDSNTNPAAAAAKLRPTLPLRTLHPLTGPTSFARCASNVPSEEPKKRAQSVIESLPGNSLVSKTAILSAGTGVSVWAIANEIYVVNEETIVMIATLSVFWAVARYGGPLYNDWAAGAINKIKNVLVAAREDHTNAVKERIEDVKKLDDVVGITKQLFEVSKVHPERA